MENLFNRKQILAGAKNESLFLWGARQTGKCTLLKAMFPGAMYIDLISTAEDKKYLSQPRLMREALLANPDINTVIIDEIPLLPALLNELHWLIENAGVRFIMSSSSPRKMLRLSANILGGEMPCYNLYPLVSSEIPNFDLLKALNNGLLPRHYSAENASKMLSAYIGSYLRDEIIAEGKIRDMPAFNRFLALAAQTNGEIVNHTNIAAETGIAIATVKNYFQLLENTLMGRHLPSLQKKAKRLVIPPPKFYFFDVGIVNSLLNRRKIGFGNEYFGKAFEHFIYQEIYAHSCYSNLNYQVSHWRTTSQQEIDFVLGDHKIAIKVMPTTQANNRHIKGLKAFAEEYTVKKSILVSLDDNPRQTDGVLLYPWKIFLDKLWGGEII